MDTLNSYRQIIESALTEIAKIPRRDKDVIYKTVFDHQNDSYLIICQGWEKNRRIHHCLVNIEIMNGKIWIQEDNIEYGVALDLEEAGIPKSDIVLGFQHPSVRPYTEYAAA